MFRNRTVFCGLDVPTLDASGVEVVVAIVKGTFVLDEGKVPRRAEDPSPIRPGDLTWDEDPEASIMLPGDATYEKVGTDVVIVGDAIAKQPVKEHDVAIKVRDRTIALRVHGERVFYKGALGVSIGPAAPFTRCPLKYELAYGGTTEDGVLVEPRNPVGVGIAARSSDLVDKPAPRIEHPGKPHTRASDSHPPVGLGAIGAHWSPRRERAGTFDKAWEETRMPLMPADFDLRFNNVAPPSLQFDPPLAPGEAISVLGMTPDGFLRFELPKFPVIARGRYESGAWRDVRPAIDTVIVFPELRRFEIVARAAFPKGRRKELLRELLLDPDDGGAS